MSSDPIYVNAPKAQESFTRKYNELLPVLRTLNPSIVKPLIQFDYDRAKLGQYPLSTRETAYAIKALQTKSPAIETPSPSFLDSIRQDFSTILKTVPQLPVLGFRELQALPSLPKQLQQATAAGDLGEKVQAVSQLPGVRLLPGAYVVGNLAGGHEEELKAHPLFAALDILPFASKAAAATPTFKAAQRAREVERAGQLARFRAENLPMSVIPRELPLRPIQTVLTKRYDPASRSVVPNRFGKLLSTTKQSFYRTPPGSFVSEAFGRESRELARLKSLQDHRLIFPTDPNDPSLYPNDVLRNAYNRGVHLRTRFEKQGVPRERQYEIDRALQLEGRKVFGDLSENELAYAQEISDLTDSLSKYSLAHNFTTSVDIEGRPEIYDMATGSRIRRKQEKVENLRGMLETFKKQQDFLDSIKPRLQALQNQLAPFAKTNPHAFNVRRAIRLGKYDQAATSLHLFKRTAAAKAAGDLPVDLVVRAAKAQKTLTRLKPEVKAFAREEKKLARMIRRNPPARFIPKLEEEVVGKLQEHIERYFADSEHLEEYLRLAAERNFSYIPDIDVNKFINEVRQMWVELRERGFDPVFIHRTTPQAVKALEFPKVIESINTPSQARRRLFNYSTHLDDASIAIPHQALELLVRKGSEEFINTIIKIHGKTGEDLFKEYIDLARARHETNPQLSVRQHLENLISKEYSQFSPSEFITWRRGKLTNTPGTTIYLPKSIRNNLHRFHTPPVNRATAVIDPIMGVFRTSLLPLSPRWHLYNILGGGIMLMARTDPTVFKYLSRAREIVKEGLPEGSPPHGIGSVPEEIIAWNRQASEADKLTAAFHLSAGHTLRRLFDQARKVTQKSYDLNVWFDDMYRAMAYLYGYDKSITKGLPKVQAQQQGIAMVRKVMQNWDEITPIERSILRYIFPFYGWINHVLRYTMSFPFDHPVRTSVLSSFAKNEVNEHEAALGQRFREMFFIGEPDYNGKVKAINYSGLNPFSDVANYFTLSGFLGSSNPIISGILKSVGIDSFTGQADLYPELRYDPETGKLAADTGNPLQNFLTSIIPQTQVLLNLSGRSKRFKLLLQSNPDAAKRMLMSQLGLPVLVRDVAPGEEVIKAEINRLEGMEEAKRMALKTGELHTNYPQLQPTLDIFAKLRDAGLLTQLTPE